MTWLHSETKATLERLITDDDHNSTWQSVEGEIEGHFKKMNLSDNTFDVSNISGTAYKFTTKSHIDIKSSDRIIITNGNYQGKYSVSDFKY